MWGDVTISQQRVQQLAMRLGFAKTSPREQRGGVMQGGGTTRGNTTISQKRIQQLAMRARVRPAAGDKRALPANAESATTGKSMVRAARVTLGE